LLHLFREVIDGGKEQDNTPDTEGECNHSEYSPGDTHFPVGCLVSPLSRVTYEPEQDCQGFTDDRHECRDRHEAEQEVNDGENKGGDPETVTGNRNRLHRHSVRHFRLPGSLGSYRERRGSVTGQPSAYGWQPCTNR